MILDLTGHKYGRLTVIALAGRRAGARGGQAATFWKCRCDCGNEIETRTGTLRSGHTISCGCSLSDVLAARNTKHRMAGQPEYTAWKRMKARCYNPRNPDFSNYGGRGIAVFELWLQDFSAFLAHMGPRPSSNHTIDRIDTNGGYVPGNVRWLEAEKQSENRRCVHLFDHGGRSWTIGAFAKAYGVKHDTAYYHIIVRGKSPAYVIQRWGR